MLAGIASGTPRLWSSLRRREIARRLPPGEFLTEGFTLGDLFLVFLPALGPFATPRLNRGGKGAEGSRLSRSMLFG